MLGLNGPDSLLPMYDVPTHGVTCSPDCGNRSPPCQPRRNGTVVVLTGSRRSRLQPCYWLYGDFSTDQVVQRILRLRFKPKDKQADFLPSNHVRGQRGSTASPKLKCAMRYLEGFFSCRTYQTKISGKFQF